MNVPEVDKVGDKTRESVKWSICLQLLQKSALVVSSVFVARLLNPADFGLATMAITLDSITWIILSLGVNSAVIHYQDNINERFNAAFWLFILSSMFFVGLQFLFAPVIANLYNEPLLADIIRVSAIGLFIHSFGAVQKTIIAKGIDFKKISILDACNNTLRSSLYVLFAFLGFGVWSFIYPKIIYAVVAVISLWKMSDWRPNFKPYFKYWGEMLTYGKNVLFSNVIDYCLNNSSYILIGGLIGSASLGIYTFAYDKSMMIVNNISYPFVMIAFPAFSRLQDHKEKLKEAFLKSVKTISLVAFPFSVLAFSLSREGILTVFGAKWESSIVILQIVLFYSAVRAISQLVNPLLQAVGKPHIPFRWSMGYAPFYILAIYLGYKFGGLVGIAVGCATVGLVGASLYLFVLTKIMNWKPSVLLNTLKPAFVSSAFMFITAYSLKIACLFLNIKGFLMIGLVSFTSISLYGVFIKLAFKDTFNFILENVLKISGRKKDLNNAKASIKT